LQESLENKNIQLDVLSTDLQSTKERLTTTESLLEQFRVDYEKEKSQRTELDGKLKGNQGKLNASVKSADTWKAQAEAANVQITNLDAEV
jgi:hypothetical protein